MPSSNDRRENIKLLAYTRPTTRNGCRLCLLDPFSLAKGVQTPENALER